ncbi:MAG TPA: TIGR03790 family protein, partial [Planctomycetota bacterium]|nr:TIGR03790 family protein [Planctomycetota bacterium]
MKRLSSVSSRAHQGHSPPLHRLGAAFLALCFLSSPLRVLRPEIRPEEVAILDNGDSIDSLKVVEMYLRLRGIPAENVLRLRLGMNRRVKREVYAERIARPLAEWLRGREEITTLVTTTGVPYVVEGLSGKPGSLAAFDNEIAAVLSPAPVDPEQWAPNLLFAKSTDPARRRGPRSVGMLRVARLDGPSFEIVERLVVDAIAVEREGLAGRVFVDARGHKGTTGYAAGDALLREGYERLSGAGFPSFLDEREQSWVAGKESRSSIAEGAAYYAGWYNLRSFQDIFGEKGVARGAIAWHLASSEAVDIWSEKERGWCVNLLRRGAAVTWGPVFEPYVHAFPHSDTLLEGAS